MFQVQVAALNDSKVIGICIYNVVLLSIVGTVVTFTIKDDPSMMYGFNSAVLNAGTMTTTSILFLPKVEKPYSKYLVQSELFMATSETLLVCGPL